MYAVYCRLNSQYERVGTFKTFGEASTHAEKLRRHPLAGRQCTYYVTGPGLPTPAGLVTSPVRPVARQPHEQPAPKPVRAGRIAGRFRRPKKKTDGPSQRANTARRPAPHRKDRRGDLSLLDRTEEELGLGIPAQWGKGRRNRKGWYIP